MKNVTMSQIRKIYHLLLDIFGEEDSFIPDRRVVENKNRAIRRTLKNITDNEEEQTNIREAIEKEMFNFKDKTYKTICDNLRNLGYSVVEGK